MIVDIIRNILETLYTQFGTALIIAVLFMFAFTYAKKNGVKNTFRFWFSQFKNNKEFRRMFFLALYGVMILMRTVLCRGIWANPFGNILGIWGFEDTEGKLYTENILNLMLFMPFVFLILLTERTKIIKSSPLNPGEVLLKSTAISFICSLAIEFVQMFLKLGTFQLSDLFFNTLGGLLGGAAYYLAYKFKHKNTK